MSNIVKRRLIVFCDGTGQAFSESVADSEVATNVWRLKEALLEYEPLIDGWDDDGNPIPTGEHIHQIVKYFNGIGTDAGAWYNLWNKVNKVLGSGFGKGIDQKIKEAYTFLVDNYQEGDEIFLFGFSRGAFTVRAIASFICNAGLLKKEGIKNLDKIYREYQSRRDTRDKRKQFEDYMNKNQDVFKLHKNVVIRAIGLWDTVGSLGIPETGAGHAIGLNVANLNESYQYHDTSLPTPMSENVTGVKLDWKAVIVAAYQALSLDERRTSFRPTLLRLPILKDEEKMFQNDTGFFQTWFPGVHTDVGGGYDRNYRDLSDISFAWMLDILNDRLGFKPKVADTLREATHHKGTTAPTNTDWARSDLHNELENPLFKHGGETDRTPGQYYEGETWDENGRAYEMRELMHPSVRFRYKNDDTYRPKALDGFDICDPDPTSMYSGSYRWVKKVDGKEDIVIYEDFMGDVSQSLLTPRERDFFKLDEVVEYVSEDVPEDVPE